MVISFSSEKPRARLLAGHRVYTARKERRKQFIPRECDHLHIHFGKGLNDWANEGRTKPKIADVIIFECLEGKPIEAQHLHNWLPWSGFETMEEWVDEIKRLNRWKDLGAYEKFYLYMVQEKHSFFKPSNSG